EHGRDDLDQHVAVRADPAQGMQDRGRGEDGGDRERGLPSDGGEPGDDAGDLLSPDAEGRARQHHRGR
ncbi:hypothetical protein ABE10_01625, partial [Bacillus toyonensis]|nr:hypothetical protein [Bacillus toyonensis]